MLSILVTALGLVGGLVVPILWLREIERHTPPRDLPPAE